MGNPCPQHFFPQDSVNPFFSPSGFPSPGASGGSGRCKMTLEAASHGPAQVRMIVPSTH